jgi:hypothetical protein
LDCIESASARRTLSFDPGFFKTALTFQAGIRALVVLPMFPNHFIGPRLCNGDLNTAMAPTLIWGAPFSDSLNSRGMFGCTLAVHLADVTAGFDNHLKIATRFETIESVIAQ